MALLTDSPRPTRPAAPVVEGMALSGGRPWWGEAHPLAWLLALGLMLAGLWLRHARPAPHETTAPFIDFTSDWAILLILTGLTLLGQLATTYNPYVLGAKLRRRLGWAWLGLAVTIAAVLFLNRVWATKTAMLGGARAFWLDDDMMISMRYARNLARGLGLVWNIKDRVEGYTNFLWVVVMAVPHWLGLAPLKAPAFMLALNGCGLVCLIALTWRVGRQLGLGLAPRTLAVLLLAGNRWVLYWAVGGAETVLLGLLVTALAGQMLAANRNRPLGWGAGALLGVLGLARADALVLIAAFLPVWWVLAQSGRTRPRAWWPALLIPLTHFLVRYGYYGEWLPNTYYLKVAQVPTRVIFGVSYVNVFLSLFGGVVGLVLLGLPFQRHPLARWLSLAPLAVLAYSAYIGGDELSEYRFYAPVLPLLLLLAVGSGWRLISAVHWRAPLAMRSGGLRFGWLTLTLVILTVRSLALPHALRELGQARGLMERHNVELGLLVQRHTRPQALVAHFWAGAVPYFSDRPALDMLGKADRHIAHKRAHADDFQPGHNKYDANYAFVKRRPDVVVTALPATMITNRGAFINEVTRKTYPGLFLPLENKRFWHEYSAQYVRSPLSLDYHGIFLRGDSGLVDPPEQWLEGNESK